MRRTAGTQGSGRAHSRQAHRGSRRAGTGSRAAAGTAAAAHVQQVLEGVTRRAGDLGADAGDGRVVLAHLI